MYEKLKTSLKKTQYFVLKKNIISYQPLSRQDSSRQTTTQAVYIYYFLKRNRDECREKTRTFLDYNS